MIRVNKIKNGDYVVCIKKRNKDFILNKLYKIRQIYDDGYVLISINKSCTGFELLEPRSSIYFFDYFITIPESRKLKLKQIKIYE